MKSRLCKSSEITTEGPRVLPRLLASEAHQLFLTPWRKMGYCHDSRRLKSHSMKIQLSMGKASHLAVARLGSPHQCLLVMFTPPFNPALHSLPTKSRLDFKTNSRLEDFKVWIVSTRISLSYQFEISSRSLHSSLPIHVIVIPGGWCYRWGQADGFHWVVRFLLIACLQRSATKKKHSLFTSHLRIFHISIPFWTQWFPNMWKYCMYPWSIILRLTDKHTSL